MIRYLKFISITLVLLVVSSWAILFFSPAPPLMSGLSYSQAVYDTHHQLLRLTLSDDGKYRLYTPLSKMNAQLKAATLLQEDQYYQWHIGVNPFSVFKAGWHTYIKGPRRMGASTITMQVARIRYGIHSKTLSGKAWQIYRALQLEMHYSKDDILEAYLNLAPYGNNVEGVGAASLIYFGKPAAVLTLPEALTLVVIPQNPTKRIPSQIRLKDIRNKLYLRWVAQHPHDKNKNAMMQLPLQMRSLHQIPFLAPHFVNDVLHSDARSGEINTTLDYSLQQLVERVSRTYVTRHHNLGVNNAAVLMIDARDMTIKAELGSIDFLNAAISGQINGTTIKRSPGSTLKPLIYALAIDQGLIHPGTVLKDVPHSFGSYNPENFDNDFVGPIKARDALVLSRNIPAIFLADQLKNPSLYGLLQQAGISQLKSESYYGLALVLGGAELSMQELTGLYATLANGGVWRPLRDRQNIALAHGKKLLSPEASFLVLDMLKDARVMIGNTPSSAIAPTSVSWKTGTSSGYRDAWTIGLIGPYVLAVWIGNFDNHGNPVFVGKGIASPLFFEIVNALKAQLGSLPDLYPFPQRMNLTKVDVCKASGMLPTRYCQETEKEWFIPGKSPIKTDTTYREIAIDSKTGLRTCHFDKYTKFEIYEFWSSDLLRIFKRAGIQRRIPPAYDESCVVASKVGQGFTPQIVSPQTQTNYIARLSLINETIIPLSAIVDADVKNLYWFANESYLGKTIRDKSLFWHAMPGNYVIRIVDDYGRSDARDVVVMTEK